MNHESSRGRAEAPCPGGQTLRRVLSGESVSPPPVWLMRQAGRYLPEYRALRARAKTFLDVCYTPELAIEATLQPIRRFGFDAAILFSDILVIPDALGQQVRFEEGEGPRLEPVTLGESLPLMLEGLEERLAPVYEAVRGLRAALPADTALIGFCGAPWTLATYMVGGRSSPEQWTARLAAIRQPEALDSLIALLVEACARHLLAQIRAGADVVQIFDSWAGALDEASFRRWVEEPARAIVARLRREAPGTPVIAFPRGAGAKLRGFAETVRPDALSVDWSTPLGTAAELQPICAVQGNLDPARLVAGGEQLDDAVDAILAALGSGPFVFNLGHGIVPDTPIAHVERLLARVRRATETSNR